MSACDEVRRCGELLQSAAGHFSQNPYESDRRSKMNEASKELLLSVTRLMVVADMVDIHNLLEATTRVRGWVSWFPRILKNSVYSIIPDSIIMLIYYSKLL